MPTNDTTPSIDDLHEKLSSLEKQLSDYKEKTDKQIATIVKEMRTVEQRTDKIEQLAEELADMIRQHKEQLEQFQNNIVDLNRTISELLESKRLMDDARDEINQSMSEVKTQLSGLIVSNGELGKLPEKVEQLMVGMSSMKVVTDTIKQVAMIFAGGIITLVINTIFGG